MGTTMAPTRSAEIDAHLDENSYGYNIFCYLGEEYVGKFFRRLRDDADDVKDQYVAGEITPPSA